MKPEYTAEFRFYEELNDFFPPEQRKRTMHYRFSGHPGIKDPIEVFGVPHTEVELIVVNGQSVGFDYQLQAGDRVAVYPVFESLDISPLLRLREKPLRNTRFIMDVNLGKLAKHMRLLGFDSLYRNDYRDAEVVDIAVNEQRIVLTRDRRLLYAKHISHGYWVRAVDIESQVDEVLRRFDLYGSIQPFVRCLVCNGMLTAVAKADILDRLEPRTRLYYEVFHRCADCRLTVSNRCASGRSNGKSSNSKAQGVSCLPSANASSPIATMSCKIRILITSRPCNDDSSLPSSNTLMASTVLEKARLAPNTRPPVIRSPIARNTSAEIPVTSSKCEPPTLNTSLRNNELGLSFKPTENSSNSIPMSARCARFGRTAISRACKT